jgi:hypothetical protein
MPALRHTEVATSLPNLFLQGNPASQLQQTACWKLQLTPIVRILPRQRSDKCTDGDMVTLITKVQQIMTGLQTADTERDRFAVMRAVHGHFMRK